MPIMELTPEKLHELTGVQELEPLSFVEAYNDNLRSKAWDRMLSQFSDSQVLYKFIEAFIIEIEELFLELLRLQDARTMLGSWHWWLTKLAQILGAGRVQWQYYDTWWLTYDTVDNMRWYDRPNSKLNGINPDRGNTWQLDASGLPRPITLTDIGYQVEMPNRNAPRVLEMEEPTPYWVTDAPEYGRNENLDDEILRQRLISRVLINSSYGNENAAVLAIYYALGIKVSFPKYYTNKAFITGSAGQGGTGYTAPFVPNNYLEPFTCVLRAPTGIRPGLIHDMTATVINMLANNVFYYGFPANLSIFDQVQFYDPEP